MWRAKGDINTDRLFLIINKYFFYSFERFSNYFTHFLIFKVNSVCIRVAPSSNGSNKTTILELILYRIDQSPYISRAAFTHIQGDVNEYEQLRVNLLSIFNEVVWIFVSWRTNKQSRSI